MTASPPPPGGVIHIHYHQHGIDAGGVIGIMILMLFLLGAGFLVYKKYGDKLGLPGGGPPLASREVRADIELNDHHPFKRETTEKA